MKLKRINESFRVLAESVLAEAASRDELKIALMSEVDRLMSKGAMIKEFEIAFQDVIERFYPDKSWWEVCDLNIFWDLMESRDPEETVQHILDSMKAEEPITEAPDIKVCPVCGRNFAETELEDSKCPKCGEKLIKVDSGEYVKYEESLNESSNAVYDMYKNQYKNLLQDIKYVLNSDNIEDIRAYDKESQGEYILSKLFDSRMNKQNMSFEDAKEDVIDFLYRTRADAKSELELRNKRSLESKSIMNKVKSELSKDYKLVSESENTLYFKAPDNSTHDDCIAFVDKVVAAVDGKYNFTGRGGSWTQWDILTPEGSYIKAGYDYSNKDNYAVYFKSIVTESRRLRCR